MLVIASLLYLFHLQFFLICMYRKDLRQTFSHVGAVRSLIPITTTMLACTATATEDIYVDVVKLLSMGETHIVAIPPERPNIMYSIVGKKSLNKIADSICSNLQSISLPLLFLKTIIFCRKYVYDLITYIHMHICIAMYLLLPVHDYDYDYACAYVHDIVM